MDHEYESRIVLPAGMGHLAASRIRDGIEDAVGGAMEAGEEATASLDSETVITLVVRTAGELGDNASSGITDAVRDVLDASLEPGEAAEVGAFELRAYPGSSPSR